MEEKVQGIRSINGRYKIDRGWLRIVLEIEKPKNLGTTHGHEPRGWGGILVGVGMQGGGGERGENNGTTVIA